MPTAFANASYPGVNAIESVEFTDLVGPAAASATLMIYPQDGLPAEDGDLVLGYTDQNGAFYSVTIANMHFDLASFVANEGGRTIRMRLLDERWQWKFGSISGRYNIKFVKCYTSAFPQGAATEFVDPDHEKTPQQLALLLIEAMGYADADWDISRLPNDSRPETNWDYANPAQELQRLCDDLGCIIVPVRSTGTWKISVAGVDDNGGAGQLPDQYPYVDPLVGVDPAESPDIIEILTAQQLFEARIPLEAVGMEMDQTYRLLYELSYAPFPNYTLDNSLISAAFAFSDSRFSSLSATRQLLTDQSLASPRDMAIRSIYTTYKVKGATFALHEPSSFYNVNYNTIAIPGLDKQVPIAQIILTENRVQAYLIPDGSTVVQPLKAYVEGIWWSDVRSFDNENYPAGSRIDLAARAKTSDGDSDDAISFSIQAAEDARFSLITFSRQITQSHQVTDQVTGSVFTSTRVPAYLYLHTAVKIRDKNTWQPMRYSVKQWVGDGPAPSDWQTGDYLTLSVIKNDIQAWTMGQYSTSGSLTGTVNNFSSEVTPRAQFYINQIMKTYQTVGSATRTYTGIFPIDMDGALRQVSWTLSKSGFDTRASLNTEHDFEKPSYEGRRAQVARRNTANRDAAAAQIADELNAVGVVVK